MCLCICTHTCMKVNSTTYNGYVSIGNFEFNCQLITFVRCCPFMACALAALSWLKDISFSDKSAFAHFLCN